MKIEDGTGGGNFTKVDDKNRVKTFAITENEEKDLNRTGKTWTLYLNQTAAGVGDYIFYLKNNQASELAIVDIQAIAGAATTLYLDKVTGIPSYAGGADITPVNRNLGSSLVPTATIKEDSNTTGLTAEGDAITMQRCAVADTQYIQEIPTDIIIPQGQAIAMRTSAAVQVECLMTLVDLGAEV